MDPHRRDPDREPPSADVQAAEYVLGLLDAQQRRRAELRSLTEPAFARLVADWERRLAALAAEVAPVPVPASAWLRLRVRLGLADAATLAEPPARPPRRGAWHNAGLWRAATALAASLALVALFWGRPPPPAAPQAGSPTPRPVPVEPAPQPPPEHLPSFPVTQLARDDGRTGWLASVDRERGRVMTLPVPGPADPKGRVAELWLIPKDGKPRSLGLISTSWAEAVSVPADALDKLAAGATLAITLEPPGGAPHGEPTGPVVAQGGITL